MSKNVSYGLGADELRIRSLLKQRGVGPDALVATAPPIPKQRPRDWLDDILDNDPAPDTQPEPERDEEPEPEPATVPRPAAPQRERRSPQSLLDAHANIPPRIRWLAYHTTAAGAGWSLGWVNWSTHTAAWFAAGHWTTPSAWVLYGLGACTVALYRRARAWAWPAAWACAVPVSSIVLGVLLYAPTQ